MKTLTSIGIQKIGQRFVDSVDHADYTLNGVPQTAEPFRRFVQGASARVYIYFDDTVIGDVAEVQLVDKDGDIIASAGERVFTKTPGKGLYIAFKYNILLRVISVWRRTVRFAGTIRPATGTTTMLRTPTRTSVSAPPCRLLRHLRPRLQVRVLVILQGRGNPSPC